VSANGKIRLALPSKGEIEGPTLHFLAQCGLHVDRRHPRQYQGWVKSVPDLEIVFQRVADIPALVHNGHATLGITGYDLFAEHRGYADDEEEKTQSNGDLLLLSRDLGYGKCRLVVAVPETWNDVSTCADLWHLSNSYHQHDRSLRIATKYPVLAAQFLRHHDIHGTVFSPQGALEAAPLTDTADLIVDLTATGTTLRENRLKELVDGVVLNAHACLLANGQLLKSDNKALQIAEMIVELIDAHALAHAQSLLTATLPLCDPADVQSVRYRPHGHLAEITLYPSQMSLHATTANTSGCTLSAMVPRGECSHELLVTVALLRSIGASSITITPLTYRFLQDSVSVRVLRERLERIV
jgi:ATP phosphoribosyltransferase